ncbi:MAG TPA: type II secretion system protein, partial [Methylomirabilota bacterium]|nr:type II secretion system protein [Methylomirabilota bacterium]
SKQASWSMSVGFPAGRMIVSSFGKNGNGALRACRRAFSLLEMVIALFILGILALAVLSALGLSKVQTFRDKELGIVSDFMVHYLEHVKGMDFADLRKGNPINPLYDGTAGAPNIRIPATFDWFSLNNTNYEDFHPELVWLEARNPQMRVDLTTTQVAGVDHTKQLRVEVRWDAPLGQGQPSVVRLDMVRVKDN